MAIRQIVDIPRGLGKSFHLAKISEKTGFPILVCNDKQAKTLRELHPNGNWISLEEYNKLEEKPKHIYIDDFPFLLSTLLEDSIIDIATFSSEDYIERMFISNTFNTKDKTLGCINGEKRVEYYEKL